MHTPNLDLVVRTASLFMPVSGMARTQNNKIIDNLFKASRKKFTERIFNPSEILELLNFKKMAKLAFMRLIKIMVIKVLSL